MILVAVYLCLGALIFKHLEGDPEIQRRQDLKEMIRTFIGNYLMIISDLSVLATFELETISFDKEQFWDQRCKTYIPTRLLDEFTKCTTVLIYTCK